MNKTALITGASSGIGAELARCHAASGGNLVLTARRQDRLDRLKDELEGKYGIQVTVIAGDLTQPDTASKIYAQVKTKGIEIDYLINNAGFGGQGMFHQRKWESDLAMIQLNIVALAALTRLFLPDFVKRNHGRIMNVSSIASLMPGPLQAVYFASKAFVTSFSNALYEELRGTGVTVTALLPGGTMTEFAHTAGLEKTKLFAKAVSAQKVAWKGYRGMLKGRLNIMAGLSPGRRLTMGLLPFVSKKMVLRVTRQLQEIETSAG
ncbi:MAG: short-chain dehydrogenase [Spirochaeta sp. LUC14_002_19_P3]|nr:MAG: short-chain dehydrogenase [Spirochaeta sp. LUC14_002_19_P3]